MYFCSEFKIIYYHQACDHATSFFVLFTLMKLQGKLESLVHINLTTYFQKDSNSEIIKL